MQTKNLFEAKIELRMLSTNFGKSFLCSLDELKTKKNIIATLSRKTKLWPAFSFNYSYIKVMMILNKTLSYKYRGFK